MKLQIFHILVVAGALGLALSGCATTTQTTSGGEYLDRYANEMRAAGVRPDGTGIDAQVHNAAAVEPLLHFPARIGLARLASPGSPYAQGELSGIPEAETKAWTEAATRLGPGFAEFVPISPLVAEMFAPQSQQPNSRSTMRETIEKIRLGAARQHVDAVIIYESAGTADSKSNPLSLAEWTLIGAFILPSQNVKAQGVAQAMLIDVRNGYPYGTVQTSADDQTLSARFATHETERDLGEAVRLSAVQKLSGEVEQMMRQLRTELAEKRERRAVQR